MTYDKLCKSCRSYDVMCQHCSDSAKELINDSEFGVPGHGDAGYGLVLFTLVHNFTFFGVDIHADNLC